MTHKIIRHALLMVAALGSAYCQSQEASLTGIVTDATRAAMSGVKITIRNTGTNIARTTTTSEAGTYTLLDLAPGTYELTAERQGFPNLQAHGDHVGISPSPPAGH